MVDFVAFALVKLVALYVIEPIIAHIKVALDEDDLLVLLDQFLLLLTFEYLLEFLLGLPNQNVTLLYDLELTLRARSLHLDVVDTK